MYRLLLVLSMLPPAVMAQQTASFQRHVEKAVGYQYLVFLPEGYATSIQAWPMVLFLHGAGERGDSLDLVTVHGPPKLAIAGQSFPFILIAPQCPAGELWDADALHALVDEVVRTYRVDETRLYVTGLSMGGYGTWDLAMRYPDRFAAIAPICGWGQRLLACRIKEVPVWTFHGAKDQVILIDRTEELVNTLRQCDGDVQFTVYPEANHDSWTLTYENPQLYDWMLRQQRR